MDVDHAGNGREPAQVDDASADRHCRSTATNTQNSVRLYNDDGVRGERASGIEPLLAVWQDKEIQKEVISALAAHPDIKALEAYLEGLSLADGNVRNKCRRAIESTHEKALPLIEARLELIQANGGDPFSEYSLPEAVLRLRQGVGRLIRTKQDSGIVVILDNRVLTKSYGKAFLHALPECPVEVV